MECDSEKMQSVRDAQSSDIHQGSTCTHTVFRGSRHEGHARKQKLEGWHRPCRFRWVDDRVRVKGKRSGRLWRQV
eukprot:4843583-Amphidinium_carterae.1